MNLLRLSGRVFGIVILILTFSLMPLARAQTTNRITVSVTVTNMTTNGMTFTLNGDTRTFTNNVFNSATQVLTNSDVTGDGSKTNLLTQIQTTPFAQVKSFDTGSNSFNLQGNADFPMNASVSAGWATFSYSTQLVADIIGLQGPVPALPTAQARTNVASGIVGGINAPENTNSVDENSVAASQLLGTNKTQTIYGTNNFQNPANQFTGTFNGNVNDANKTPMIVRDGTDTDLNDAEGNTRLLLNDVTTALYGTNSNARLMVSPTISFMGDFNGTPRFYADNVGTTTVNDQNGTNRLYITSSTTALLDRSQGNRFVANDGGTFIYDQNNSLQAFEGTNGLALSKSIIVSNNATIAGSATVGTNLSVGGTTTLSSNLTITGNATIAGNFSFTGTQTNGTYSGTHNFVVGGSIAFARFQISSLANGVNSALPIGTNEFIEVSGPTGAFSIAGIAAGRDGEWITILNRTGQQMTFNNDSGSDPTPANRILTFYPPGDFVMTNGFADFVYSTAGSRWMLRSHNP